MQIENSICVGDCMIFPRKIFAFQQDLAPAHNSMSTQNFFQQQGITVLAWSIKRRKPKSDRERMGLHRFHDKTKQKMNEVIN